MNITFNLNDAKVYIPSGRLMNLKHELQWDKIYSLETDFLSSRKNILANSFNVNFDFSNNLTILVKNFIGHYRYKEERQYSYSDITKNTLLQASLGKLEEKITLEHVENIMEEVKERVSNNTTLQSKNKKLKQLKEINKD
jgi:hypothetical protein